MESKYKQKREKKRKTTKQTNLAKDIMEYKY